MLQRSDEWHEARRGKITASSVHKIMGVKGLGQTGLTYLKEVASEHFVKPEQGFESFAMKQGTELEPLAFEYAKRVLGEQFLEVRPAPFIPYGDFFGASPDGLVYSNDKLIGVLEIKCPMPQTFFKNRIDNEIKTEYIWQIEMQVLCTGVNSAYYLEYCIVDGKEVAHLKTYERDRDKNNLLINRLPEAETLLKSYIQKIHETLQKN